MSNKTLYAASISETGNDDGEEATIKATLSQCDDGRLRLVLFFEDETGTFEWWLHNQDISAFSDMLRKIARMLDKPASAALLPGKGKRKLELEGS